MFSPPSTAISQSATKYRINISTFSSIHTKHSNYIPPSNTDDGQSWDDQWSFLSYSVSPSKLETSGGAIVPTRGRQRQHRESETQSSRPLYPIFTSISPQSRVIESSVSPLGLRKSLVVVQEFDKEGYDQEVLYLLSKHKPARPRPSMARSVDELNGDGEVVFLGLNGSKDVQGDSEMRNGNSSDEELLADRVGRGVGTTSQRKKVARMDALETIKIRRDRNRSTSTTETSLFNTSAQHARILNDTQPTKTTSSRTKAKETKENEYRHEDFGNEELLAALGDDFGPPLPRDFSRQKEDATDEYDDLFPMATTNASGSGSGSGQSAEDAIPWTPSPSLQSRSNGREREALGLTSTMADVKPLFLQSVQYDEDVVDLTNEEEDPIDGGVIDLDKEDEPATAGDDKEDYFDGDGSSDYFGGDEVFDAMDWEASMSGPSKAASASMAREVDNAITISDEDVEYGDNNVPPLIMLGDLSPRKRRFFETHWLGGNSNQATGPAKQQLDDVHDEPATGRPRGGGRGGSKPAWRGRGGRGGWQKRGRR